MADPGIPPAVKLFVGMLSAHADLLEVARAMLEDEHGPVDAASDLIDFDFTRYYEPEMGSGLKRQFLSFAQLVAPDRLARIKLRTNEIEREIALRHRTAARPVNLDPGYLTLSKVILATTKDHAHRIYLADGIYAEVTLSWRDRAWRPWPWTYPDYVTDAYVGFFSRVREGYAAQLKGTQAAGP